MKSLLKRAMQAMGYGAGRHVVKRVSHAQDWAVLAQELAAQFAQVRHYYPDGQGWRVDIVSNRRLLRTCLRFQRRKLRHEKKLPK